MKLFKLLILIQLFVAYYLCAIINKDLANSANIMNIYVPQYGYKNKILLTRQCGKHFCVPGFDAIFECVDLVRGEGMNRECIDFTFGNKVFHDPHRNRTWGVPNELRVIHKGDGKELTKIYKTTKKFMEEQTEKTGAGFSFGSWFSASVETEKVDKVVRNNKHVYTRTEQHVKVYELTSTLPAPLLEPSELLQALINRLPTEYNKEKYYENFVKYVGTHIVISAQVGGEAIVDTALYKSYYQRYQETKVKAEASAEFDWLKANAKYERSKRTNHREWVEQSSVDITLIGGDSTRLGMKNFKKWAESVPFLPLRIHYKVIPIWEIIKDKAKADNIKKAILDYKADNPPPKPEIVPDCRHVIFTASTSRPQNGLKVIGKYIDSYRRTIYIWLVSGPNRSDKCVVSWRTDFPETGKQSDTEIGYSNRLNVDASIFSLCRNNNNQLDMITIVNEHKLYGTSINREIIIKEDNKVNINTTTTCKLGCNGKCASYVFTYQPRIIERA